MSMEVENIMFFGKQGWAAGVAAALFAVIVGFFFFVSEPAHAQAPASESTPAPAAPVAATVSKEIVDNPRLSKPE